MDYGSVLGFEDGWRLIGEGMTLVVRVDLRGINLESALGSCVCLHSKAFGNGLRLRVLVAGPRGGALRRSIALSLRQPKI